MSDVIYNISSGFFDSVNGDRLYSAADMNKPYKRVIADGIFPTPQGTPSTDFQVVAVSGMSVAVLAGNAMIGARWAENTDDVGITIAGNSSSSPRIDSIFLHIDTGMDTRAAGVVYRQGTAAGTPTAPAMVKTDNITELRLADILVAPSAAIITQANITDQRGGSDCPWVAGLIQQVDTSALFDQYRAAYAEQQQEQTEEWKTFMDHLARDYDISMSLRKQESTYTSTAAASLIPINIDGYDTTKDLLQVFINGIFAVEGTHYIVKSAAQIQLTNAISAGQKVHFVIYKAVMGGAQPIIPTDEQVQDAVDAYMDAHPGALVVDPELSDTSTHAIQNKAVTEAIENVNGRLREQQVSIDSMGNVVGTEAMPSVTFTNSGAIKPGTGVVGGTSTESYSSYIPCGGYDAVRLTTVLYKGNYDYGLAFYDESKVYISGVRSRYDTTLEASTYELRELPIPDNAAYIRTTWFRSSHENFDKFSCLLIKSGTLPAEVEEIEANVASLGAKIDGVTAKEYSGENVLDPSTVTEDKFINNTSGTMGNSTDYAVTDFIPVEKDEVLWATWESGKIGITMRYVAAYDADKHLMSTSGAANVANYTVPEGVAYVRISGNKSRITGKYARITRNYVDGQKFYYEPYFMGTPVDFGISNRTEVFKILGYPLTVLPSYILNTLAYRPLGPLTKGYICLVSDDGDAELETYTIPMLQSKGDVPCTFAVMRVSTVFGSQSGIDAVVDAVQNHGCEIAQHGLTTFDQFDELTLNRFFDDEKVYWDSLGLTAYGAVCPAHNINNLIRAICGGRFGCLRTGYADGVPYYPNYTNGPKSNIYGLTSQSSLDGTLDTQKATLDYVKANNLLRMVHWHENELNAEKKAQLEGIIDYAQSIGLTFITMKDIPNII